MPIRLARTVVVLMGALAVSACSVFGSAAAPEPEFTTIEKDAPFEVRAYPELVLVKAPMSGGSRGAFGRLFDYISGANNGTRKIDMTAPVLESGKGEKIAMTAPVLRDGTDDGVAEMAFILPAGFSAETAPLPTDPAVSLDVIPARRVAVVRFSGRATPDDFDRNRQKLEAWMTSVSLVAAGPAELAQYNPPWTLPWARRNEVLIPVAER